MRGRRIGELGNYKTTAYIAAEFKRMGLKPAGDSGTWFQNLPYGFTGFDAAAKLAVGGASLVARRDWIPTIPTTANGAAARVDLPSTPTVFAGRMGDTTVALDPALFRGKVAVFLAATSATPAAGGAGRGGAANVCSADQRWPNQRGTAFALASAAAARGRAGAPAAAAAGGRGAGRAGGGGRGGAVVGRDPRPATLGLAGLLLAQESISPAAANAAFGQGRGSMRPLNPVSFTGMAAATITTEVASQLFGKPLDQLTIGAVGQPVSGSWNYEWRMSATPARNVIAMLPGSDPTRATQYVLVGAHNDHNGVNATAIDHDSLRAWNTIMRPDGANANVNCRPNEVQQHLIDSLISRARSAATRP